MSDQQGMAEGIENETMNEQFSFEDEPEMQAAPPKPTRKKKLKRGTTKAKRAVVKDVKKKANPEQTKVTKKNTGNKKSDPSVKKKQPVKKQTKSVIKKAARRVVKLRRRKSAYPRGVNLIGFIRAETGIGESVRLAARSLINTDIPFGTINYPEQHDFREDDTTWAHMEMKSAVYKVNLFHINGDRIKPAAAYFGPRITRDRYNIGYWHWELPDYPQSHCAGFDVVQEVWVPSNFVLNSISTKSKVPVVRIPHGIQVPVPLGLNRDSFGLPNDRYLFCAMADSQSYQKRKNPLGAIEAFKRAFAGEDPRVGLVIKLNNAQSNPEETAALQQAAAGHANIYIIDQTLTREEVNALISSIDCFVSLHRAEGFGLPLAEAMYLGKPVVGTNWSGNTDFMHPGNSCAVNYELVDVGEYWGPYDAHQKWAEPDIDHASEFMRKLIIQPDWARRIALAGQKTIHSYYSPYHVGQLIKQRLRLLGFK
ncbi:glycosyltransferase family 4 protein [Paenibacillus sp. H1-7]|uniref:glycosyltransferase family 4 protein n=1 Tax=Paenibacillus sp. H1-7 TaxID=2282849 RepID=UPI001EF936ED|nr:glycosyltransferase family 4 protein [Paenibacillus sp. H1-7]